MLGVNGIEINSKHFSAQDRKRFYWTNIEFDKTLPTNATTVEDILEAEVDSKYLVAQARSAVVIENDVKRRKISYTGANSQGNGTYNIHGKSVCLCANSEGFGLHTGLYALPCLTPDRLTTRQNGRRFKPAGSKCYTLTATDKHGVLTNNFIRRLTPVECERLQTIPDNYTEGCTDNKRYALVGNSWTVNVITHILKAVPKN